eukprot:1184151-Prorocentrum_minimum.AAC.2
MQCNRRPTHAHVAQAADLRGSQIAQGENQISVRLRLTGPPVPITARALSTPQTQMKQTNARTTTHEALKGASDNDDDDAAQLPS